MNQLLIDLPSDNPIVLHPAQMSNAVALLISTQLREGNFATDVAQDEFLLSCVGKKWYSIRQKQYIYNLGRKFQLI